MKQLVMAVALLGCGGGTKPPVASPPTEQTVVEVDPELALSPALVPLQFMLGNWALGEGREFWVAAAGAMYGIAFPKPGEFEVMIIDDGEGAAMPDGVLRFIAMPGGKTRTEFRASVAENKSATWSNPEHDAPKTITYEMTDEEGFVATLDKESAKPTRFVYDVVGAPYLPALNEADRTFAADTLARGADGFMSHVTPAGFTLNRQGEVVTGDALRAMWDTLTKESEIVWEPIHSSLSGDLGFTVGKATFTDRKTGEKLATTYCTIWELQDDNSWKVVFDVGRVVNGPIPQ